MRLLSRIVGILLLVALAASSAGAQALMMPSAQSTHPAGCHGRALPTAPAPTSHHCCIVGHNHAVPGNLFSGLTLLPCFGPAGQAEQAASAYRLNGRLSILIPSALGLPGPISLRI
jgi:hypothetical protein